MILKKLQIIISLPSVILMSISLIFNYKYLMYISLAGIFLALIIKQVRSSRKKYVLGHPERKKDKYYYDDYESEGELSEIDIDIGSDD